MATLYEDLIRQSQLASRCVGMIWLHLSDSPLGESRSMHLVDLLELAEAECDDLHACWLLFNPVTTVIDEKSASQDRS